MPYPNDIPKVEGVMLTKVTHLVGSGVPDDPHRQVHDYFDEFGKFVCRVDSWEKDFGVAPEITRDQLPNMPGVKKFPVMTAHSGIKTVMVAIAGGGEFEWFETQGEKDHVVIRLRIKED